MLREYGPMGITQYAIDNKEKGKHTLSSTERSYTKKTENPTKVFPKFAKNPLGPMSMTSHNSTCTTLMRKVSIFSYDFTY